VLIRQKIILALLSQANKPLSPMEFVKLVFLLRQETELKNDRTFYDFVPYKYGPFSFDLYRELSVLRQGGYVTSDEERIALCQQNLHLVGEKINELPVFVQEAIDKVINRYGYVNQKNLVKDIYARYPWYATRSEITEMRANYFDRFKKTSPAVYTSGYEGRTVDSFFNHLLRRGIELVIDVRANPISRRYGFSKRQFAEIAKKLGLAYCHMPGLGIPSEHRINLSDYISYQHLLDKYEQEMLPGHEDEINEVGELMKKTPAILMCVEKDVRYCHRSRLAKAISDLTGLEIKHL